jgi:hypothetical protein
VLAGLPALFGYLLDGVERTGHRDSLVVVIYHLLGDVANAAEHAVTHYLPLALEDGCLQNSSWGTPYQKWARFTNEDFEELDQCLRRLIPAVWNWHHRPFDLPARKFLGSTMGAWHWLDAIRTEYAACVVSPTEQAMTLSAISMDGWIDPTARGFLYPWESIGVVKKAAAKPLPPIVIKTTCDISERAVIAELQRGGLARVGELRSLNAQFANWLQTHCSIEDVVVPHDGTLSGGSFG